jgi:hypothetical protein
MCQLLTVACKGIGPHPLAAAACQWSLLPPVFSLTYASHAIPVVLRMRLCHPARTYCGEGGQQGRKYRGGASAAPCLARLTSLNNTLVGVPRMLTGRCCSLRSHWGILRWPRGPLVGLVGQCSVTLSSLAVLPSLEAPCVACVSGLGRSSPHGVCFDTAILRS